jgi:peptidoglycan/xylan/chitin deacetylase (PgdA/CDA1 family)
MMKPAGKRELLARGLLRGGATFLLRNLPQRDSLLVLNYHRVGNAEQDLYDPWLFSATAEELDAQISFLKRQLTFVTLDEAMAFIEGHETIGKNRCRALLTFDDGYLDNYQTAFPILRSHGVQGVFFLATDMVGSNHIAWWDRIAYIVKTARRRSFTLRYPISIEIDLDKTGLEWGIDKVLSAYKLPENTDSANFISELIEATQGDCPYEVQRRYLDWTEARAMIDGGMAIGSHTQSHPVLSQLDRQRQERELSSSREILKQHLGVAVDILAYPVGQTNSFSDETKSIAESTGYRAAFSFYGGINLPGVTTRYDVKRESVGYQSWERFRVQASVCGFTGKYWP